jgi:hypothetical protein
VITGKVPTGVAAHSIGHRAGASLAETVSGAPHEPADKIRGGPWPLMASTIAVQTYLAVRSVGADARTASWLGCTGKPIGYKAAAQCSRLMANSRRFRHEPGRPGGQHRMGTAQTRRQEPFFPLSPAPLGGDRRVSRGIIYLTRHSLQRKAPPLTSEVL